MHLGATYVYLPKWLNSEFSFSRGVFLIENLLINRNLKVLQGALLSKVISIQGRILRQNIFDCPPSKDSFFISFPPLFQIHKLSFSENNDRASFGDRCQMFLYLCVSSFLLFLFYIFFNLPAVQTDIAFCSMEVITFVIGNLTIFMLPSPPDTANNRNFSVRLKLRLLKRSYSHRGKWIFLFL